MLRLLLCFWAAVVVVASGSAHNTGTAHAEFSEQELRNLGLEEFIEKPAMLAPPDPPASLLHGWVWDPWVVAGLATTGAAYAVGVARLWRRTHVGGGISRGDAFWYACGWTTLFLSLVSPLHTWGEALFSAHMIQHELLMLVAAPLLVFGRPGLAFLWALPSTVRMHLGSLVTSSTWLLGWRSVTNAFSAWFIHAVLLWMWHIPSWFQATLTSNLLHAAQHICFLGSAILFWWAIIHGRQRALGYGAAVLYMFTTALHSGVLGALLTFTQKLWYPAYTATAPAWGLTAMEDQQLGGLIMWVPAGLIYIAAGLALFAGWLRESERRARRATWSLHNSIVSPPRAATTSLPTT